MNYRLIFSIVLALALLVGCSSGSPVQPQYQPTIGPLRPDHEFMAGEDYYCARHIPGKVDQCGECHIIL